VTRFHPASAARWIGLAYLLAVLVPLLVTSLGEEAGVLLMMPFVVLWMVSPVVATLAVSSASRTRLGAAIFLAVEVAIILSSVGLFVQVEFFSTSSTAPIAFIVWPFFQWCAWLAVFILALMLGWRAKESWLNG
jgi:hypothetical protein